MNYFVFHSSLSIFLNREVVSLLHNSLFVQQINSLLTFNMNMNDAPTVGSFLPHSLLTEFLRKHENGLMWISIFSNIFLVLSLWARFYSFLPKFRLSYLRKYGKEPSFSHFVVIVVIVVAYLLFKNGNIELSSWQFLWQIESNNSI